MNTLKIWFTDFYLGFDNTNNPLSNILKQSFNIVLDKDAPDYLIYSCYGNDFLQYTCIRIYYTGESLVPDFNLCDYGIGYNSLQFRDRYLRYPNFALFEDQFDQLTNFRNFDKEILKEKKQFCNFIYSNPAAHPARDQFFHLLNAYREIISPGKHLNNSDMFVGDRFANDWMFSKLKFQAQCKFSIAFENDTSPGYTTEKILHAFITNTIPIYWGNPEVTKDFNPKAFINCHNYENLEDVVNKVKEIDNDEEMYLSILNEPPFRNNIIPENLKKDTLLAFLKNIFDQKKEDASQRLFYGTSLKYENNIKALILLRKKYTGMTKYVSFLKNPLKILKKSR